MSLQKKGLGRGLSALIPDAPEPGFDTSAEKSSTLTIDIEKVIPSPFQPRRAFDPIKIEELAASIRSQGIIQPLVVRAKGGQYELIAGERRWRAAVKAGLEQVPAIIREASDREALQLALVENLQREDLNAIEEANGYRKLQEEFHWSQEEVAEKVGRSRPTVANALRLLSLPPEVQQEVISGRLPAGQARALLGLQSEQALMTACREVVAKGLSTRDTEKLVKNLKFGRRRRPAVTVDPDLRSIVEQLQRQLGTKVRIYPKAGSAKGKIEIEYYSHADLERVIQAIVEKAPQHL